MMNDKNTEKFRSLINQIKDLMPDTVTRLAIVITADEIKVRHNHRYPDQLKNANISMRNIKGDFIKDIQL
jgi:hypothetical protein